MTHSNSRPESDVDRRREERFHTSDDHCLHSRTSLSAKKGASNWAGVTIDISPSGMRLLTDGNFHEGQAIWIELLSTHSHGVFRAHVRRVESWTEGKQILGCSLTEPISDDVLRELASAGIINQRRDGRYCISRPCKVAWPLGANEIDAEIQDYSAGGMKLLSAERIPDAARMRICFEADGSEVTVEAFPAWRRQIEQGWITGLAFSNPDASPQVARALKRDQRSARESRKESQPNKASRLAKLGSFFALCGFVLFATL